MLSPAIPEYVVNTSLEQRHPTSGPRAAVARVDVDALPSPVGNRHVQAVEVVLEQREDPIASSGTIASMRDQGSAGSTRSQVTPASAPLGRFSAVAATRPSASFQALSLSFLEPLSIGSVHDKV